MDDADEVTIRAGMPVYGSDGQTIGAVEEVRPDGIRVNGRMVLLAALWRVTEDAVYLRDAGERLRPGAARQWRPRE